MQVAEIPLQLFKEDLHMVVGGIQQPQMLHVQMRAVTLTQHATVMTSIWPEVVSSI